jgi:hypothetical protein
MRAKLLMTGLLICSLIMAIGLSGCASNDFLTNSYNTLNTVGTSYDVAMTSAGEMYRQGHLTEQQKENVIAAAEVVYTSFQAAVAAVQVYEATEGKSGKEAVTAAINQMLDSYNQFIELVNGFIAEEKK